MNWTLIARTLNELRPELWAAMLCFLGAFFTIGNDQPGLLKKVRAVVYGTLFGYYVAQPCVAWLPPLGRGIGYITGGLTGVILAEILLNALKLARENPTQLLLFIWQEAKEMFWPYVSKILDRITTKKTS